MCAGVCEVRVCGFQLPRPHLPKHGRQAHHQSRHKDRRCRGRLFILKKKKKILVYYSLVIYVYVTGGMDPGMNANI